MTPARTKSPAAPHGAQAIEERARLEKARGDLAEARFKTKMARARGKALDQLASAGAKALRGHSSITMRGAFATNAYNSGKGRTRLSPGRATPPRASAAANLDYATRDYMLRETQDAERNNSLARALVQRHIDFVDGDGPLVNPKSGDEGWNAEVRDLYRRFMQGEDHEVLGRPNVNGRSNAVMDQRELTRAWDVDGDMCFLKTVDENGLGSFQAIESLRLGTWSQKPGASFTGQVVDGVEMDGRGLPVAFHFSDWELGGLSTSVRTRRIPAEHVIYCPNPKFYRAGQVRGEPRLQSCLQLLELTNNYINDTGLAASLPLSYGIIFQDERPQDLAAVLRGAISDQPARETSDSPYEMEVGPAWSLVTKPGQKPVQMQPEFPTTNFGEYVMACIQIMGADFGLPLAIAMYASKEMSYSNMRGVLSVAGRGFDFDQAEKARIEKQKYLWKLQEWMARGVVSYRDDWNKVHITFPRPPVVDLKMEIEAMALAVDKNFATRQTAIESVGFEQDHEETVKARGAELKREIAAGVAPLDMPGATRPGTPAPAAPAPTPENP